jgi:BlaI family transcriptional regulator, penicillinase repressor
LEIRNDSYYICTKQFVIVMSFQKPTDSELEILQILWQKNQATVREVNDQINLSKETGYTTTLKLMQIMNEKGLVIRDASEKQHVYSANISESDTQKSILNKFIETTFQGNAMNLVMQALGNHKASDSDLLELKKLLSELEKNK